MTSDKQLEIARNDARRVLLHKFAPRIQINRDLSRRVVSNQANKDQPLFKWFRYKEAFADALVNYLLAELKLQPGKLLDPFAGVGTALFAARERGWDTVGIELLPVGTFVMKVRLQREKVKPSEFREAVDDVRKGKWRNFINLGRKFEHVSITTGAFSSETENELHGYLNYCDAGIRDEALKDLMTYAAFAVLEAVSFTRKDGQYLRWDSRAGRSNGSKEFIKGPIYSFEEALYSQLEAMWQDLSLRPNDLFDSKESGFMSRIDPQVIEGSCLERLPEFDDCEFDIILTSPPYCNRYDYTRTYALELIFLGAGEQKFKDYRQAMLTCTVENKEKNSWLRDIYSDIGAITRLEKAINAFESHNALQEVLAILEIARRTGKLNNPNIVRMVSGYFLEMSVVIFECARVLKPGGYFVMVNDNVSYHGQEIPVDLILSSFAEGAGLEVLKIWQLEKGKGNSSQQMEIHGRKEQRKCVYLWRKPTS